MFRPRTSTTASTDVTPNPTDQTMPLPEGHDDPASWFYVPEELRATWIESARSANLDQLGETIKWAARRWALTEADERRYSAAERTAETDRNGDQWVPDGDSWLPLRRWIDRGEGQAKPAPATIGRTGSLVFPEDTLVAIETTLLTEHHVELRDAAAHSLRMRHVIATNERAKREAKRAAEAARRTLCPVCGQSDDAGLDVPERRSLRPGVDVRVHDRNTIVSCSLCFLTAQSVFAEQVAEVTLLDHLGRTRRDAVRAALATQNG